MDPDKVDIVVKWKVPTHTGLLRGFIRSVGYLANNVPGVRLPLGMQSAMPFHFIGGTRSNERLRIGTGSQGTSLAAAGLLPKCGSGWLCY
jgi:hypothetical protein